MNIKHDFIFGAGKQQSNHEFKIISNINYSDYEYDYLIFTDSKGNCNKDSKSWTNQLIEVFNAKNITYLLITRPKEMTIFFSLINFISNNNNLKFKYLITNVGFVDTTPKKKIFINDIFDQNPYDFELIEIYLCDYQLNSGEVSPLYTVDYEIVIDEISKNLSSRFEQIYLISTFVFKKNIKIERKRPDEFFEQLKTTNNLLKKIESNSKKITYIDVGINQSKLVDESQISYDAVHFTQKGHDLVFSTCINQIMTIC